MKILIPFSGGVNSTYALWRWLSETDHKITAVCAEEQWSDKPNNEESVVVWLRDNIRSFEFEKIQWPVNYISKQESLRTGFRNTTDMGMLEPRYHGYKKLINDKNPDGIVIGISLENTATDNYERLRSLFETAGVDNYFAGSRELIPIAQGKDFNDDMVSADLMGRFEQWEKMPSELVKLIPGKCNPRHDPHDISHRCMSCLYESVREKRTDLSGAELDSIFAKYGSYGKWRSEADPKTYAYRGQPHNKALELLGINSSYEDNDI